MSQTSHLQSLADCEADSCGTFVGRLQKKKARAKLYIDKCCKLSLCFCGWFSQIINVLLFMSSFGLSLLLNPQLKRPRVWGWVCFPEEPEIKRRLNTEWSRQYWRNWEVETWGGSPWSWKCWIGRCKSNLGSWSTCKSNQKERQSSRSDFLIFYNNKWVTFFKIIIKNLLSCQGSPRNFNVVSLCSEAIEAIGGKRKKTLLVLLEVVSPFLQLT